MTFDLWNAIVFVDEIHFDIIVVNFVSSRKDVTSEKGNSLSTFRLRWRSRQRVSLII